MSDTSVDDRRNCPTMTGSSCRVRLVGSEQLFLASIAQSRYLLLTLCNLLSLRRCQFNHSLVGCVAQAGLCFGGTIRFTYGDNNECSCVAYLRWGSLCVEKTFVTTCFDEVLENSRRRELFSLLMSWKIPFPS